MRILASLYKRERIANLLTRLINQESLSLTEERKHERIVPRVNASKLILPDDAVHNCRVSASVACSVKPEVGMMVILGGCAAEWSATMSKGWHSNSPSSRTPTASPAPWLARPPPLHVVSLEAECAESLRRAPESAFCSQVG